MPYVTGLDLSLTSTGVCVVHVEPLKPGVRPPLLFDAEVGTVTTKPGDDKSYWTMSQRIYTIVARLTPAIQRADLIVLEGPSLASVGGYAHARAWLWGAVYDRCIEAGKDETLVVAPSQRVKYAVGKGSATKDAVLAAAIKRWPNVDIRGHDTADAMILAAIGCRYLGLPIDTVPKASWEPVMAKLNMMLKPRRRRIVNVELPERI